MSTYRHNDSWLSRDLVRNIDVHVDFGRVGTKVVDFFQLRGQSHLRGEKPENSLEQHLGLTRDKLPVFFGGC